MKEQIACFLNIFILASIVIILSGCAAKNTEQMLAASGFTMQLADTPEKLEHLKTLTQRKIFTQDRNGKPYFIYADADSCKCLYAGDEENYHKYQDLLMKQDITEETKDASKNQGMWKPWGPWDNDTHR
jgi:hypothetical protein